MAYLLRKIRKTRWTQKVDWLFDEDIEADPLSDLATKDNELSVYHVTENKDNLHQVIAALAVSSNELSNIDFALFDESMIVELGIKIKRTKGGLADDRVNNWHSDIYELSASKVLELAKSIKKKATIERKMPKEVLAVVADSLENNLLDRSRVKWKAEDLKKAEEIAAKRKMQ
jgi:hypothetical protein